jgi:hypothetical protein
MYAYNAGCTVANILFSEPTAGTFRIVRDLRNGVWMPWEVNHLLSSVALSCLIVWWGIHIWNAEKGNRWSPESRVLAATVVAIAASGALGFNYTRDRMGGMALPFYAFAAYFAVRAAGEHAMRASRGVTMAIGVMLLVLGTAWQLRALGTIDSVHLRSAKVHRNWITDLQHRRTKYAREGSYLRILNAMTAQGIERPPVQSPRWAEDWLGER